MRGLPVCEDLPDVRLLQDAPKIVRHGVFDARIRRAGDLARGDHIPQRNAVFKQERALFRDRARRLLTAHRREHAPEAVLRVVVEKLPLARLDRRELAENQNAAVFVKDGRNVVKNRHVHAPFL